MARDPSALQVETLATHTCGSLTLRATGGGEYELKCADVVLVGGDAGTVRQWVAQANALLGAGLPKAKVVRGKRKSRAGDVQQAAA